MQSNSQKTSDGNALKLPVGRMILALVLLALVLPVYLCDAERHNLTNDVRQEQYPNQSFIELRHGTVHYRLDGPEPGPVVVLVHGFSAPARIWFAVRDRLVASGFRVLTFDLYGRGLSDRPTPGRITYNGALYRDQLGELLTALKLNDPIRLVGLSMGGAVSVMFTAAHPDRVDRLVLLAPAGHAMEYSFTARAARWPWIGDYIMRVMGDNRLLRNARNSLVSPDQHWPAVRDMYQEQMQYVGYKSAILSTLRNFPDNIESDYEAVGRSGIPVLVIWGDRDTVVPIEHMQLIRHEIPDAQTEILHAAGHLAVVEAPDRVHALILDFLY
ncbi:MAG: alpha/beta hydrolase [Leptospiraceae bacterium]|nr:alpha/beta hydrolase [Leptospiraceae bacterium]